MSDYFQMPLNFDEPKTRKDDPETSKEAASKIDYDSFRAVILKVLFQNQKAMATFEIGEFLGYPRDYISPHLKALTRGGWVSIVGSKVNPKTKNKVKNQTYYLTKKYFDSGLQNRTQIRFNKVPTKTIDRLPRTIASGCHYTLCFQAFENEWVAYYQFGGTRFEDITIHGDSLGDVVNNMYQAFSTWEQFKYLRHLLK